MPSISRSQVLEAIQTAKALTEALDVDQDGDVGEEEINRVKIVDHFVTRTLWRTATYAATYPSDLVPTPAMLQAELATALKSLDTHDTNGDGVFTDSEQKGASKVAKALVAFALQHAGKAVAEFKIEPYEKPGSAAWVALCQKHYYDASKDQGPPRFGTALVLGRHELPSAVRKRYDTFAASASGKVEATALQVNGAKVYYFHALTASGGDARIVNPSGKVLSKGVLSANGTAPNFYDAAWDVNWS